MQIKDQQLARDRVLELADDARYRPFVVGYLLSCLDERHWASLVQAALEFGESRVRQQDEMKARAREIASNGG
jgi:hypothetical protein